MVVFEFGAAFQAQLRTPMRTGARLCIANNTTWGEMEIQVRGALQRKSAFHFIYYYYCAYFFLFIAIPESTREFSPSNLRDELLNCTFTFRLGIWFIQVRLFRLFPKEIFPTLILQVPFHHPPVKPSGLELLCRSNYPTREVLNCNRGALFSWVLLNTGSPCSQ